ncbi:MAG: hypothetical protein KAJ75_07540, partial [Alphaproteobacteria bacterium]|nr:hypothetical protein [Alphaproteobacteria bacterium]
EPEPEPEQKSSHGTAITSDGIKIGEIQLDGSVVDENGKIAGYTTDDGTIVDNDGNVIGKTEKSEVIGGFVPPGVFSSGRPYGIGMGEQLGPGGGYGPGEKYGPESIAALRQAQAVLTSRRRMFSLGNLKPTNQMLTKALEKRNKDWTSIGINKITSTFPVDQSRVIRKDKPIPAVLVRSIDSRFPVPVSAIVERNVYASDGRNVIIPAGSRIIGEYFSDNKNGSATPKMEITWQRLIRPDGAAFSFEGSTADAQGRGGVAGYVDLQIARKYALPLMTSSLASAVTYMMTPEELEGTGAVATDIDTGVVEPVLTPREQSAQDARETFSRDMERIFNDIFEETTRIPTVLFVPSGTRMTIFPNEDLWLRQDADEMEEMFEDTPQTMSYSGMGEEVGREVGDGSSGMNRGLIDETVLEPAPKVYGSDKKEETYNAPAPNYQPAQSSGLYNPPAEYPAPPPLQPSKESSSSEESGADEGSVPKLF